MILFLPRTALASRSASQGGRLGRDLVVCLLLGLTVLAVYGQAARYGFVDFDDDQYVFENPQVRRGLTWEGIKWALTATWAANWHPLTWISHMLDCEIWGLRPGCHHMTSVALHMLNSILFYLVFFCITKAPWRSAIVAGLFALHPLHVESVAWIAERKDVLSTLLFLVALWAYTVYVRRPSVGRYGLVFGALALGLAAKPMLVTTPFVLLLLDLWPLGRLKIGTVRATLSRGLVLLAEKGPLLLLSAASSVITFVAQQQGGATTLTYRVPLGTRLANAVVSYVAYLAKAAWPARLAVFYPYRDAIRPIEWIGATFLLGIVTFLVLMRVRRRGYLAMGWFWYLGMLVPVIGLVQVGEQAMADRYTYVPLVGVFVMAVWGVSDLVSRWPWARPWASVAAGLAIGGCLVSARSQVAYWRSGVSLLEHALEVAGPSALVHNNLGVALHGAGRNEEAVRQYREALRFKPGYARAHYNLGISLAEQGNAKEAAKEYREAIRLNPGFADAYTNLGVLLASQGRREEAIQEFRDAIRVEPRHVAAHYNLGIALARQGRREEAIREFREAIRLEPGYADAHNNLAIVLARKGKTGEAAREYREAIRLDPRHATAHYNLAVLLAGQGRPKEAIREYREALRIDPTYPKAHFKLAVLLAQEGKAAEAAREYEEAMRVEPNNPAPVNDLAWIRATHADRTLRNGIEAVRLAERAVELAGRSNPNVLDTLAAAYAEAGRFTDAVATLEEAIRVARSAGLEGFVKDLEGRLSLYRSGRRYREIGGRPDRSQGAGGEGQ